MGKGKTKFYVSLEPIIFAYFCSYILRNTTHENSPNRGAEISENDLLLDPVECLAEMEFAP